MNLGNTYYTSVKQSKGMILTRYVKDGVKGKAKVPFKPSLFQKAQGNQTATHTGLKGEPLVELIFENMASCREYTEKYKNLDAFKLYGTTNYIDQFVTKNFGHEFTHNPEHIRGCNIDIEIISSYRDSSGNVVEMPFDREITNNAGYPVSALTMRDSLDGTYYVLGLEEPHNKGAYNYDPNHPEVGGLNVEYKGYSTEQELLRDFVRLWSEAEFDYYTGWNAKYFDITYLSKRIHLLLGKDQAKKLSPWGQIIKRKKKNQFQQEVEQHDLVGIEALSYDDLYKKFTFKMLRSYKLDSVAEYELGEKKMDYSEVGSLNTLYFCDYPKYINYNIKDVVLVQRIDEKMKLIDLVFTLAYLTKVNYEDTMGSIKQWSSLMYHSLMQDKRVAEIKSLYQGDVSLDGAYVRDVIQGKHKWVCSCDLNSLYPHIMQNFCLGPETIIDYRDLPERIQQEIIPKNFTVDDLIAETVDLSALQGSDICMTPNKQFFHTSNGSVFNTMTRHIYASRKTEKKLMLKYEQELVELKDGGNYTEEDIRELEGKISAQDNLQMAYKILMNSLYGCTSNKYFTNFFDIRIASAITISGQLANKWQTKAANEAICEWMDVDYKDYSIAMDTDSFYVVLEDVVNKQFPDGADDITITDFLSDFCENVILKRVKKRYDDLAVYMNVPENRFFSEREVIAPSALWVQKKNYCMNILDSEGVRFHKPKLKIMGLASKKSSTAEFAVGPLEECYKLVLGTDDESKLHDLVEDIKERFNAFDVETIATPSGVNGLEKYSDPDTIFIKGAQKHVKSALFHNELVKRMSLHIPEIQSGMKLKYVDLKIPNPSGFEVIGFVDFLPPEFGLHEFVDRKKLFNKSFIDKLQLVLNAVNWHPEKVASVLSFFM